MKGGAGPAPRLPVPTPREPRKRRRGYSETPMAARGGRACPAGPMRVRSAGRAPGARGSGMADTALFEFLLTEMVAELWARDRDPDPDPGPGVSARSLEGEGVETRPATGRPEHSRRERISRRTGTPAPPLPGLLLQSVGATQGLRLGLREDL